MESYEIALKNGKVWFGEAANRSIFVPVDYCVHVLPSASHVVTHKCCIYLGLLFQGEPSSFGRLGCQFLPNDSSQLTIKVAVSTKGDVETSGIGLPDEYGHTVFDEAVKLLTAENKLGSGELIFDRAEFHLVDSNPYIFRLLTNTLLYLLNPENKSVGVQEINQFVANLRQML